MKGIIGIVGDIEITALDGMRQSLSHRGTALLQIGENYGLGQLNTCSEQPPFTKFEVIVISDSRIDNMSQICEMAEISAGRTGISTNELILAAYSKLGIGFAEFLIGDFSIAILDKQLKKIFLIRDHLGIRPLYYTFKQGKHLAFASEPKALLTLSATSKALNRDKLNEYLQWPTDFRAYRKETFYETIFSVIPATVLEIDLDLSDSRETFYWKINPDKYSHLTSETLITQACLKVFERAVDRRLQNVNGIHVSGGLDSSSVYKMAEKLADHRKLFTIHFYPDHPDSDERKYAQTIIPDNRKNHIEICRTSIPISEFRAVDSYIDRPDSSTIPTATKTLPELKYFKTKGVTVVLTGHDGDTVIGTGTSYFINLICELRFEKFKEYFTHDTLALKLVMPFYLKLALAKKQKDEGLFSALKLLSYALLQQFISYRDLIKLMNSFFKRQLKKIFLSINPPEKQVSAPPYVPENLDGTMREHFSRIYCSGIMEMNEILNLTGAAWGIEYAHPFLDKDFIELSLMVPEKMRVGPEGLNRYFFREAMKGVLPEEVRLRQSKTVFNLPITLNLISMIDAYLMEAECAHASQNYWMKAQITLRKALGNRSASFKIAKKFQRILLARIWQNKVDIS